MKVDTSAAIESAKPLESEEMEGVIKPGPYGTIVADPNNNLPDVKAEKIIKGEDTGGPEQQLNGMGGIEGQFGGVS